jgi:hypothetical protein
MAKKNKQGGAGGGRTPKHSNDSKRSNKAVKGQRDANTVSTTASSVITLRDRPLGVSHVPCVLCRSAALKCTRQGPSETRRARSCTR